MESYSCTTYKEQFNGEILNDKEKQEGCLQVTTDGEILRAEVQHISPKGRHTLVISSNPMQQKAFQPWGKRQLANTERKHMPGELERIQSGQIPSRNNLQDHSQDCRKCLEMYGSHSWPQLHWIQT